jgi:hypothetical protein
MRNPYIPKHLMDKRRHQGMMERPVMQFADTAWDNQVLADA